MTRIRRWRTIRTSVVIIETSIFTRRAVSLLSDDEYRTLQVVLATRPTAGSLIRGSGGLRKIRWAIDRRGKRGGVRVIYHWAAAHQRLLMLLIYSKNERDDLRPDQLKALKKIISEEFS